MSNKNSNPKLNETPLANKAVLEQEPHRQQQATQISTASVPDDFLSMSIFNAICCIIFYSVKTKESIKDNNLVDAQQQSSLAIEYGYILVFNLIQRFHRMIQKFRCLFNEI